MSIAIVNSSTVVSDADGETMVKALNQILPQFCKDWSLPVYTAIYIPKGKTSSIVNKIFLWDTSYIQGALGYHSLSSNIPYGKCFAKTVLEAGGAILYSPTGATTVAQCVTHEVFELLIDPLCNSWWDIGDGQTLVAKEVCDPVQGNDVLVKVIVSPAKTVYNTNTRKVVTSPAIVKTVGLSDWVLPAWSNPQNTAGPFNYLKTLKAPFTLDTGGYVIQLAGGTSGQVAAMKFGVGVTEAQKAKYSTKGRMTKKTT